MEEGQGVLDAAEVDEVAGQVMRVRGRVLLEDGDSVLGASGAGEELGDVRRRVRGSTFGVGAGPCDRFVDTAASGDQRQSYPVKVPLLLAPTSGGESVEVCQTLLRAPLCEAKIGQSM